MRFLVLGLTLLPLTLGAAPAQPQITEPQVRAFMEHQERAWNAGDLAAYFATYAPGATFTDQAYAGDKGPIPYGTSTLAQARAQARKSFARSKVRETAEISRVEIAADGRSARVTARLASTVETAGRTRRLCGVRVQGLTLSSGRLLSTGQTDTLVKCAPAAR